MIESEKSYAPPFGPLCPAFPLSSIVRFGRWNSYGFGLLMANFIRVDSGVERSEACARIRTLRD